MSDKQNVSRETFTESSIFFLKKSANTVVEFLSNFSKIMFHVKQFSVFRVIRIKLT